MKHAISGQPIRRWHKKWTLPAGAEEIARKVNNGDLYQVLMDKVKAALGDKRPTSVAVLCVTTFWSFLREFSPF
ncbi:hypothetical protein [Anatilimnocola aggregata]|uniref:hypothetical protein n=1 Tax=Anatilimnocola aggregata TaxID=2528021 RepID=UPI0011A99497|nr:hypothetical protein [Anatilimnocola aggregata]